MPSLVVSLPKWRTKRLKTSFAPLATSLLNNALLTVTCISYLYLLLVTAHPADEGGWAEVRRLLSLLQTSRTSFWFWLLNDLGFRWQLIWHLFLKMMKCLTVKMVSQAFLAVYLPDRSVLDQKECFHGTQTCMRQSCSWPAGNVNNSFWIF